jgi:hypothetical protein
VVDNDDVCDSIPEVPRPKVNGNPQPNPSAKGEQTEAAPVREVKPSPPKIHPALYSWMRTRILARAYRPPDNPRACVRAAQEEFLGPRMLPLEIEEYLLLTACDFFKERNRQNPGGNIPLRDCIDILRTEARKHHLPISHPEIWDRVVRAAGDSLGWIITSPVTEVESFESRQRCRRCGKTKGWHDLADLGHEFV